MFQTENKEESVKRFERSKGLDTALYKIIPFFLSSIRCCSNIQRYHSLTSSMQQQYSTCSNMEHEYSVDTKHKLSSSQHC